MPFVKGAWFDQPSCEGCEYFWKAEGSPGVIYFYFCKHPQFGKYDFKINNGKERPVWCPKRIVEEYNRTVNG